MLENRKVIWDALCEMKDSYAVAASAFASVDSVAKIFDTGGGYTEGLLDIYASVVTGASTPSTSATNLYHVSLEGSASATFASPVVELANMQFGNQNVVRGDRAVGTGLYKLKWNNMFGNTVYRYLRVYTTVGGATPGVGITYTAILSK